MTRTSRRVGIGALGLALVVAAAAVRPGNEAGTTAAAAATNVTHADHHPHSAGHEASGH